MKSKILLLFGNLFLFCSIILPFSFNGVDSTDTNQLNKKRKYHTQRISKKPIIDGNLDDDCWEIGVWAEEFTQWIPNEGAKPSQNTALKILYDEENIYVAIRAFDTEPDKITRRAGRRDEFHGDIVGVSFDSYHDHRTAFEFDLTAAGQKIDLLLSNPMSWDVNWNAVWTGEVAIEDSAWTAEFEIPFSQLRFSDEIDQVWGMHCWRWIDRLQEESDWEPQSSTGPGILFQFGELHGLKNLSNAPPIEIMPYVLGELNTSKPDKSNPFKPNGRKWSGTVGIDAKIGLSNNFTLDLTVNPDFGQVEADPSVMNLTVFETFYEEKRPFFLEGKNIFNFDFDGNSIFYSRRIGHSPSYNPPLEQNQYIDYPNNTTILSALKLSGKSANGLALGVLQSLTQTEKAEISENGRKSDIDVEPLTNYLLLRLQKDYDAGNTVLGGILTSTNRFIDSDHLNFLPNNSYTGGVDFLHHWDDKKYFVDAKLVGSYINGTTESILNLQYSSARYFQRPDASHLELNEEQSSLSGYGGSLKIGKGSGGLWKYSTDISWRSPGLELNDIGYINVVDLIKQTNSISYFVNKPVSFFRTYNVSLDQTNNWNFDLEHLSSSVYLKFYSEFLNKWAFSTNINYISNQLDTRILRGGSSMLVPSEWSGYLYVSTDPSEKIFFNFSSGYSKAAFNRLENYYLEPGVSFLPLDILKVTVSLNYYRNTDELQYVDNVFHNNETKYILGHLEQKSLSATLRFDYNLTPELSIQYYGSPFISIGKYSNFKQVRDPKASDYNKRTQALVAKLESDIYNVQNSSTDQIEYSFANPDFNFFEFRSNFVIRWEYRPGSQIYFVWSQERSNFTMPGRDLINDTLTDLGNVYPNNIFLIKFNYWLNL